MAKQTLLEMTQEILESMESDIVDSILDTSESSAVASMIRRTYWDLFGVLDLPENYTLFQLVQTSSVTPTIMTVPENCMKLEWLRYDVVADLDSDPKWQDLPRLPLREFMTRSQSLSQSADSVGHYSYTFDDDPVVLQYVNTRAPQWYTSPDDLTVVLDAINIDVETFAHANKTLAYGLRDSSFTVADDFVPDLDSRQFSLLFNESKALAFAELKQTQNATAEQRSRRLMVSSQRTKNRLGDHNPTGWLPDYGRRAR